ncbi:MAG: zinc ribbon domain-containing protein [Candidatus Sumerlaeota bacterium]|nr:zinc ribbon domain-containing protein [Candidatus Sumerlaeota bacterium]
MPIYEYACHHCRKIYQFFSKTMKPETGPACPKCGGAKLERVLSSFAAVSSSKTKGGASAAAKDPDMQAGGAPGAGGSMMDDPFARMSPGQQVAAEREMMKLMSDADGLDESDPRQLGHLMERMTQITGIQDKTMNEAIRRLKDGEDPEKIEADMGDIFGDEGGPGGGGTSGYGRDPDIYDM